jgi:hypothetical protein
LIWEDQVMIANRTRYILALTAAGLLAATAPALAEIVSYKADLNGASEVPPTSSKAIGSVTATYDTASKKLSWKGNYSGLSGDATAAHFHGPALAGQNGDVAVAIPETKSPFEGSATLTDNQATELAAGKWYVNVHTAANPDGEIRGQVVKGQ